MRLYKITLCLFVLCALLFSALDSAAAGLFQKNDYKAWMSINTEQYELAILKNGKAAWQLRSGQVFFREARPQVLFAGKKDPKSLDGNGKSTTRQEVISPLGAGQGLSHMQHDCEWLLNAYPTKSYITAQIIFINSTKKPVRIAALSPWHVEKGTRGAIFPDVTPQNLVLYPPVDDLGNTGVLSAVNRPLTLINPANAKSFIAGFTTQENATGEVRVEWKEKGFISFDARCVYDPPIEVAPGESLASEVLYLAASFDSPLEEITRFGKATALMNNKKVLGEILPHGWVATLPADPTAFSLENFEQELDLQQAGLAAYGWDHVVLAPQQRPGPLNMPQAYDFKVLSDAIHARGLTAGLKVDAFSLTTASPPALKRAACAVENLSLLDVHDETNTNLIAEAGARWVQDWGMDAIYVEDATALSQVRLTQEDRLTRIAFYQAGIKALRQGTGGETFISMAAPEAWTGANVDAISLDTHPQNEIEHFLVDKFYFHPHMYHPILRIDPNNAQTLPFQLGLGSLTGSVMQFTSPPSSLQEENLAPLRQALPVSYNTMMPLDAHQQQPPRLWGMAWGMGPKREGVAACVNWETSTKQKSALSFPSLDLRRQTYYTVFDPLKEQYYGIAQEKIDLSAAPRSIRFLQLKPYDKLPVLLETSSPFYVDDSVPSRRWDEAKERLFFQGAYSPRGRENCTLSFLVPKTFRLETVLIAGEVHPYEQNDQVAQISFNALKDEDIAWEVRFLPISAP